MALIYTDLENLNNVHIEKMLSDLLVNLGFHKNLFQNTLWLRVKCLEELF